MLFWWLSLFASQKPLTNLLTWLVMYSGPILLRESSEEEKHPSTRTPWTTERTTTFWWYKHENGSAAAAAEDDLQNLILTPPPTASPPLSSSAAEGVSIVGTYKFENSSNLDAFLKEVGVPYMLRSLSGMAMPIITISKDCQVDAPCLWSFRTDTMFMSHESSFRLGEWVDGDTMDGRSKRFLMQREGSRRLVEEQDFGQGREARAVLDFTREGMSVDQTSNGVHITMFFSRQFGSATSDRRKDEEEDEDWIF